MLALMPQEAPSPILIGSNKMSVAMLSPATLAYSRSSPSPSKKPKLSLNTSDVPANFFGKSSTSLRLDALSATSPTSRNTFSNAYKATQARRTSASRAPNLTLIPLTTRITSPDSKASHIDRESPDDSDASLSPTLDCPPDGVTYNIAFKTPSILRSSLLPVKRMRKTQSGPMFPANKKVAFRTPLTEDIKTTKFVMKHSDIESSSTISTLELSPSEADEASSDSTTSEESTPKDQHQEKASPPPSTDKQDPSDDNDSDSSCPATPVTGRTKRSRQWVWTLSPVDGGSQLQRVGGADQEEGKEESA